MSEAALVSELTGVGPKLSARLQRLGIERIGDLLWHLPLRYQDRTRVTPLGSLQAGSEALIEAEVLATELRRSARPALLCRVHDGSGKLTLRFFHFSAGQQTQFARGARLRCYGLVSSGPTGLEMVHPEYQRLTTDISVSLSTLTPTYPSTEGLHQGVLRKLIDQALALVDASSLPDLLPLALQQSLGLPGFREALHSLHQPPAAWIDDLPTRLQGARRRLAFEELLAQQLGMARLRHDRAQQPARPLVPAGELRERFLQALPFTLTAAQQRVEREVRADLAQPRAMMRLVQGDVGSGKTVVAALAALTAVEAGQQAAFMAPTELLSEQHYHTLAGWLHPLGVTVALLTGRQTGKARQRVLDAIAQGQAQLVVGTHALFQAAVRFNALALAVIDEQHRFGVHQRLALRLKGTEEGASPHQLIMTATPIPRTLAMSVYADLATSVIDELPPGRQPVVTVALPEQRREHVIARLRAAAQAGRQAYWVCPLIEESEVLQCQAAEATAEQLRAELPQARVGLIHGRLKSAEKERAMAQFQAGELDILVATTVIEVGVDVPNASLMIIENAERLGLAQLHQLRGRVGRGPVASSCVLFYKPPLAPLAHARLAVLRETNDGFVIAERDLALRGPGELMGVRQAGELEFKIADLMVDAELLPAVRQAAEALLATAPESVMGLIERWGGVQLPVNA